MSAGGGHDDLVLEYAKAADLVGFTAPDDVEDGLDLRVPAAFSITTPADGSLAEVTDGRDNSLEWLLAGRRGSVPGSLVTLIVKSRVPEVAVAGVILSCGMPGPASVCALNRTYDNPDMAPRPLPCR